jgi:hypothetical protein
MRHTIGLSMLLLAIVLALASPAAARVALIQTTAQVSDSSEPAVRAAVKEALEAAVRGALAMGLSRMRLEDLSLLTDGTVLIRVLATDTPAGSEGDEEPAGDEAETDPPAAGVRPPGERRL